MQADRQTDRQTKKQRHTDMLIAILHIPTGSKVTATRT